MRFSSIVGMDDLKKTIRIKIIEPFLNPGMFAALSQAGGRRHPALRPARLRQDHDRARRRQRVQRGVHLGRHLRRAQHVDRARASAISPRIFEKARAQAPCVLFFDELDALAYSRSKANSEHTRTVVNEFLAQLDGVGRDNQGVLILAATNMPWDVDPAMKRPGRFSRQIFVPPPDAAARAAHARAEADRRAARDASISAAIAKQTAHYSGADIDGLVELAKESALEDNIVNGRERD